MTGALLDAMCTRRAALECNTSAILSDNSGPERKSKSIRRKSITKNDRFRSATALFIVVACAMFSASFTADTKSTANEIDKVYGRPNIEPARPTNPSNGVTAYRRSGTGVLGAAHYYGESALPPPNRNYAPYSLPISNGNYAPPSSLNCNYASPSSPNCNYVPPPSPNGNYVPPPSPNGNYVPPSSPNSNYVPPPSPNSNYVPPPSPNSNYVPPSSPNGNYVPPPSPNGKDVPLSSPNGNYVPPPSPNGNDVPPSSVENYGLPSPVDNYPPAISSGNYVPPIVYTGPFRYKDDKGCIKVVQYVHWPLLRYALRYYDKHYAAQPLAYSSDEEPPIYVKKKHVEDDKKNGTKSGKVDKKHDVNDRYVDKSNGDQKSSYEVKPFDGYDNYVAPYENGQANSVGYTANNHIAEADSYASQPEGANDDGYQRDGYVAQSKDKASKYDKDYAPKPAEGYGFKKLIVPVHDVYNQKAHPPPLYDLSDLIFPADSYNNPPSLPYSTDGYEDKARDESDDVYEPTGEIDSFGAIPFQEKKAPSSYHPNPVVQEKDYASIGRDEFGVLPYKESVGGPPKETYESTPSPSYNVNATSNGTVQQSSLNKTLGSGHAIGGVEIVEQSEPLAEENFSRNVTDEAEPQFRSELNSVAEIDNNESPPGESVTSEAFLKGPEPQIAEMDDLTAKTDKERSKPESADVDFDQVSSQQSTSAVLTVNATVAKYTVNTPTVSSVDPTTAITAEVTTNLTTSALPSEEVKSKFFSTTTATAILQNETVTSILVEASPTPSSDTTAQSTVSAMAREQLHRQFLPELFGEDPKQKTITNPALDNEIADDLIDSPAISESTTLIGAESMNNLVGELTTLATTAAAIISEASDITEQSIDDRADFSEFGSVTSSEAVGNTELKVGGLTNSTLDESTNEKSSLDSRDKRNVSVGPFQSALGRAPAVKNKPKDFVGMRPALFHPQDPTSGDEVIPTVGGVISTPPPPSPPPSPPPASQTLSPATNPTAATAASTASINLASALAQAEEERQKLEEPGPSVDCTDSMTPLGGICSPFFKCNANEKVFSCWDDEGDTSELVYDSISQECRKFEAISACTQASVCAGKSGPVSVSGACSRLAFNCDSGALTKCDVAGTAVGPDGGCAPVGEMAECVSLVSQTQIP